MKWNAFKKPIRPQDRGHYLRACRQHFETLFDPGPVIAKIQTNFDYARERERGYLLSHTNVRTPFPASRCVCIFCEAQTVSTVSMNPFSDWSGCVCDSCSTTSSKSKKTSEKDLPKN